MLKEVIYMDMPKRPIQHQAEDLSILAFEQLLPKQWVYRVKEKDYGIDGEVEVFEDDGTATGIMFYVQLKATDSDDEYSQKNIRLKSETINYYKALELPVIIVRYISKSKQVLYKWSSSIDPYPYKDGQKTFGVKFDDSNLWTNDTPSNLHKYLSVFLKMKKLNNILPINVFLDFSFTAISKYKPFIIKSKIRELALENKNLFKIVSERGYDSFIVKVTEDTISTDFLDTTGCYFHSIDKVEFNSIDEVIGDILLSLAVTLLHFNKNYNSIDFLESTVKVSKFIRFPQIANYFIDEYIKLGQADKALELWENVDDDLKNELDDLRFHFLLSNANTSLKSDDKISLTHEKFLLNKISEFKKDGKDEFIGPAYYNYANHLRSIGNVRVALTYYRKALKYNDQYYNEHYIFSELAGVLFELGKYKVSVSCYKHSLELKYIVNNQALYADALMMSGQYSLARDNFRKYFHGYDGKVEAEWILKDAVLDYIIQEYDLEIQDRKPNLALMQEAYKKCGKEKVSIEEYTQIIKLDALDSLIWFDLGIYYANHQNYEKAMMSFLSCALLNRNDSEAWFNTLKSALAANKGEFVAPIIYVGYKISGELFLNQVFEMMAETENFVGEDAMKEFYVVVNSIVDEINEKNFESQPLTMRLFNGSRFVDIMKNSQLIKTVD